MTERNKTAGTQGSSPLAEVVGGRYAVQMCNGQLTDTAKENLAHLNAVRVSDLVALGLLDSDLKLRPTDDDVRAWYTAAGRVWNPPLAKYTTSLDDLKDIIDGIIAAPDGNGGTGERRLEITWASEIEPEPVDWLWVDLTSRNIAALNVGDPYGAVTGEVAMDDIACVIDGHTWAPPAVETEGRVPCGMVSIAAGREGSGKSSFGIWLAARLTRGTLPGAHYGTPKRVFYVATEDSWKHPWCPG